MKHKLKELNEKALQAMLDGGFKYKTAYGANWYIWNRLSQTYGDNEIFSETMIVDYCNNLFGKDIFKLSNSQLNNLEKRYKHAFNNLINYINFGVIKKDIPITKNCISDEITLILNEYLKKCEDKGNNIITLNNKKETIKRFIIETDFPNIDKEIIREYINNKRKENGKITYTIDFRIIRNFLIFCTYKKIINTEILLYWPEKMNSIINKNIPSYYTDNEIRQLLLSANNYKEDNHLRNYSILLLIAYTGIRATDVANLKINNFDWHNNIIKIVQNITKKEIIIPLLPEFGNIIVDYITNERKSKSDYLFINKYGNKITGNNVSNIIKNYFLNSKIDIGDRHYSAHALRHSLATRLINNNYSFFEVANTLGHQSINSIYIYAKVNITNLKKCVLEAPYNV